MTILLAACSGDLGSHPGEIEVTTLPASVERMLADRAAPSPDVVEVWICDVPADSTAPIYGGLPLRLPLTPEGVVDAVGDRVHDYVAIVSGGRHDLRFVAGGTVAMSAEADEDDCVAEALARSTPEADVVLAVATAEHAEGFAGGRGRPGTSATCDPTADCSAAATGRAAVVGASDFHPSHGDVPLLDLIEHELGHTFGWPHSAVLDAAGDGEVGYVSAIDLMSDSASPRVVDRSRLDGPLPLAIDLFDAGWLPLDQTAVVSSGVDRTEIELVPLVEQAGIRLAILPVDDHRVLTLEHRTPTGFDDHLPEAGVAVHLVDDSAGSGVLRVQRPVHTDREPFTDLLGTGDVLERDGWRIEIVQVGATARLAIAPTDR